MTAQWAAFICWVDDQVDRPGLGTTSGAVQRFTAPLRKVLAGAGRLSVPAAAPHAVVLAGLWQRTAPNMPDRWRERFTNDYVDFLDATEQEVALRCAGARFRLEPYLRLRRRTITLLPMLDVLERTGSALLVEAPVLNARLADLRGAVADVAGWANDLASHADDKAVGQDNLVTILARERGCSRDLARMRVAAMIEERRTGFRATAKALRGTTALAPVETAQLRRYVDLVETFMAATLRWLACTGRFTTPPGEPAA